MNTNERKFVAGGGIFIGFLLLLAAWVWMDQPGRPAPTIPPALAIEEAEEISPLSFQEVLALSGTYPTTKTALQIAESMASLVGQRVYWDGYVGTVHECGTTCYVSLYMKPVFLKWFEYNNSIHLENGDGNHWAQIYFDPWHRSQLLKLEVGQKIRVGCTFTRINVAVPILGECNLIGMAAIPEWQEPIPPLIDNGTGKPKVIGSPAQPQVINEVKGFLRELPIVGDLLSPVL